jgi:aryl-alcohol dehydrogenase-like predicted oxidoreductase
MVRFPPEHNASILPNKRPLVRLGQSGLKVSRIILGLMSYGSPEWAGGWVQGEEEGIKHIKAA